jgi:hypothetical protein
MGMALSGKDRSYPVRVPNAMVAADFNRDKHLDLAFVALDDRSVNVPLGNGDGSFESGVAYHASATAPRTIALVDLDQDGKIDLAVFPLPLPANGYFLMGNYRMTVR